MEKVNVMGNSVKVQVVEININVMGMDQKANAKMGTKTVTANNVSDGC